MKNVLRILSNYQSKEVVIRGTTNCIYLIWDFKSITNIRCYKQCKCCTMKKCKKDFFLTHTTANSFLLFAFLFSLMRESLKCNLKCISHLCLLCRHDKIKIALVEYVEQINAHNINIYVWISVQIHSVL